MKTKLLFTFLLATQLVSAQYYINELVVSPPNTKDLYNDYTDTPLFQAFEYAVDDTMEYFEFRGPANATIPADTYFIAIDGDLNGPPGEIQDAVELGGLSFGSNGILLIVSNMTFAAGSLDTDGSDISGVTITNKYSALADAGANVVVVELTGTPAWIDQGGTAGWELDKFNSVSKVPDLDYDGSIIDQSATYAIIQTPAGEGNPDSEDIDSNDDGVLDGLATGWTFYDAVTILDDDDASEFAYSNMIFLENPDMDGTPPFTLVYDTASLMPSIIELNQYPSYVARQGLKTGNSATVDATHNDDWMAGRLNSRSNPDWAFSSTDNRCFPADPLQSSNLSDHGATIGKVNVDFATLSVNDEIASKFNIYPNPAKDFINIESRNINISSVNVFNILGTKVIEQKELTNSKLDVSALSNGIYFLKISADNGTVTKKFIVE